ncbi:peptidase M23 [Natrinema saccharevitans]|uniref:Peptidase M23 n=1 Tax=Natrinema saccharevitans TaxID=301967 RepID=A0A1S8AYF8_9EURY|nr:peptidoglycan DD-metalloendopeptidase family protein [Natrinema saccharevitans]OLZ41745.1 peptidase M23 [Natrinema saccharevitans]
MIERIHTAESTTIAARVRRRLRSFEPLYLALLGLLAVPSYVVDSLAVLEVFEVFFLFFLWPLVSPLLDLALRRGTDERREEPTDWIHMGNWREYAAWFLTMPLTFLNPLVLAQDLSQWFGTGVAYVRHRGSFPDVDSDDQRVSYRLPFDGTWTVVNGSYDHDYSHSWLPATQRYAYDFVITDADGRTSPAGSGSAVGSYYCYDEPILAPADGVVVDVFDTDFESPRGGGLSHPLKRDIRGSYVVIQHAPDEYSCLAHLVPGSAAVALGDRVERGQEIGRCGHSGNSSEPHLHFQLQDHPRFELAAGLPIAFDAVDAEWPGARADIDEPRPDGTGDATDDGRTYLSAGQRVAPLEPADTAPSPDRSDAVENDAARPAAGSGGRLAAVQRAAFGTCVGGAVAVLGPIVVSRAAVALLLVAGVALAAGWHGWVAVRRTAERRPGGLGIAVGLGLVAAAVRATGAGTPLEVGTQTLGALAILGGFVAYAALGEFERYCLRESFPALRIRP